MVEDIEIIFVTLGPGDTLWNKLKENVPGLAYTEQELVVHKEILAFIAEFNGIRDFRLLPTGRYRVPKRFCKQAVIEFVRSHPERYDSTDFAGAVDRDRSIDIS